MLPIETVENSDGVKTIYYFGKEVGWICKSKLSVQKQYVYKTLSVHGNINYFDSIETAKHWLIAEYH